MAKKRVEEAICTYVLKFPGKDDYWVECVPSRLGDVAANVARQMGFTTNRVCPRPVPYSVEKTQCIDGAVSRYEVARLECSVPCEALTGEEFNTELDLLLQTLPVEFQEYIRQESWDRGHSSGLEETLGIARSMYHDLAEVLMRYHARMTKEGIWK